MNNYLYYLIAKSFNLIDTVQPLVLSVFEPLPEANLDWEQLVTTESTELETTSQTDGFSNFEILQSLEWRSPATNLQISEEITNPLLTNLTSTPISSQQILKSIPNLAHKPDLELSSNWSFSESALTQISTDNQQLAVNTQRKTSPTPLNLAPAPLQNQLSQITPVVAFVQPLNIHHQQLGANPEQKPSTILLNLTPALLHKQSNKINPVVPSDQLSNIDYQQFTSNPEQNPSTTPLNFAPVLSHKQLTQINPVVAFVQSRNIHHQELTTNPEQKPSTSLLNFAPVLSHKQLTQINPVVTVAQIPNIHNQQLTTNAEEKTSTTPLNIAPVLSHKQLTQINHIISSVEPSNVINYDPLLTQPFRELEIVSTTVNKIVPSNTEQFKSALLPQIKISDSNSLISLQTTESNTSFSSPIFKERQLTPEFIPQEPIDVNHQGFSLQLHIKSNSQISFSENPTKSVIFSFAPQEKIFSQPNPNTTILKTAIAKENNAPISKLNWLKSGEFTTQLLNNQSIENTPGVYLNPLPKVLYLKKSLPQIQAKTRTILSVPNVIQQGRFVTENLHKQITKINSAFTHSQLPQPESYKAFLYQLQSETVLPLTDVLTVETITPTSTAIRPQEQLVSGLPQKRWLRQRQGRTLQTENISTSEILSSQIIEQPTAIPTLREPLRGMVSSANAPAINQVLPLTPVLTVDTSTPALSPVIQAEIAPVASDSHLSDFHREKASDQEVYSQNYNRSDRQHIPIQKIGVVKHWDEFVNYAHHPANMQHQQINPYKGTLTSPVENSILPENASPNLFMSADRFKERQHIPIQKIGVVKQWDELGQAVGEMNVNYAHHPANMQQQQIDPNRHLRKLMQDPSPNLSPKRREALIPSLEGKGGRGVRSAREFKVSKSFPEMSNEDILTSPVENLILPQNVSPNLSMSADRGKDGVESSYFRQLEESDLRPLSEPINDLNVKNLSVIAHSSKKLQKRWRSQSQTSPAEYETSPTIQVTIGKLEIRSAAPAPPPPRPKPRPAPSVMSLNEYLQRRARGR